MKTKLLLTTLSVLLFAIKPAMADNVVKDTVVPPSEQKIPVLYNGHDTIILKSVDTVFANNITRIKENYTRKKVYDTVYVKLYSFLSITDQKNRLLAEKMLGSDYVLDDNMIDIGGDDDFDSEYLVADMEKPYTSNPIEIALDGTYAIPAEDVYHNWSHEAVNPYNIDLSKNKDTVRIEMLDFVYPLTKPYHVTSKFGSRRNRYHYGIDLKLYVGDTVVSPMSGMVRIAKQARGYGNYVVIRHYNGLETIYGHLSEILVQENQVVSAGDIIALGGNTGRSTGSHLHWEFRYLGTPINPEEIVNFDTHELKNEVYTIVPQKTFKYVSAAKTSKSGSVWVVRKGDSLGKIAQKTGTPIARLCSMNKITRKTVIKPGQRLKY